MLSAGEDVAHCRDRLEEHVHCAHQLRTIQPKHPNSPANPVTLMPAKTHSIDAILER